MHETTEKQADGLLKHSKRSAEQFQRCRSTLRMCAHRDNPTQRNHNQSNIALKVSMWALAGEMGLMGWMGLTVWMRAGPRLLRWADWTNIGGQSWASWDSSVTGGPSVTTPPRPPQDLQ